MSTNLEKDPDASFIAVEKDVTTVRYRELETVEGAQGVRFSCPMPQCGHLVQVYFSNPVGAPVAPDDEPPRPRWHREGTTLGDLTLRPSINIQGGCGWHGFVIKGVAR